MCVLFIACVMYVRNQLVNWKYVSLVHDILKLNIF